MAKQIKAFGGDSNNFSEINSYLDEFDKEGALLEDYSDIETYGWIDSGNYLYNAQLSGSVFGGFPINRVSVVGGDPKTGKSYVMLNAMENLQSMGYFVWFFETEFSPDRERFKNQRINGKMARFTQPESAGEIIVPLMQFTEGLKKTKKSIMAENKDATPEQIRELMPKIAIIIDSISSLNSAKQIRDAVEEGKVVTDMGTIAREIKLLFNLMTVRMGKLGIPCLCTAHVYEKDKGNNFKEKVASGGMGAIYLASVISFLTKTVDRIKGKDEEGDDIRIKQGIFVTSDLIESRYSNGSRRVQLYISTKSGLQRYLGLSNFVSWELCGIDKGKFVDFVDPCGELLIKKMATKQDILSHKSFSVKELHKSLAQSKQEGFASSMTDAAENGYIEIIGGDIPFNPKKIQKFRFISIDCGVEVHKNVDILKLLTDNGHSKDDISSKSFSTQFVVSILKSRGISNAVIEQLFTKYLEADLLYIMGNIKFDINKDQNFKFKIKNVDKLCPKGFFIETYEEQKESTLIKSLRKLQPFNGNVLDVEFTTDLIIAGKLHTDFEKHISDGMVKIIDIPKIEVNGNQTFVFTNKIEALFDGDKYNKIEKMVGVPKSTSPNWIVKHLGRTVTDEELHTKHVFSQEVLEKIDTIIKPIFSYNALTEEQFYQGVMDEKMDEAELSNGINALLDMAESQIKSDESKL